MSSVQEVIQAFQSTYDLPTLTPSQALHAMYKIRAAAYEVRAETIKQAINPLNLGTAQGICETEAKRMDELISRFDDVYIPEMEKLASDPATNTPGAGALVTVFYNAGIQTDPATGKNFTTPEYVAPAIALSACAAAEKTMIEAYQDLGEDLAKGAQEAAETAAETAKDAFKVGIPIFVVAFGVGAFFAMRNK